MNTNINQGSAKIYQFPTNAAERSSKRTRPASDLGFRSAMAVGESWYHQDAVEEETRANSVIVPFDFPRQ